MEPTVRSKKTSSEDVDELHLLIVSMDDELSGYRWREAVWFSLLFHALVVIIVLTAPKWLPSRAIILPSLDASKQNQTFVVMPSDLTTPPKPPKTDIISDKNRLSQSRTPVPSPEAMRRMTNTQAPGAPTPNNPPPSAAQQPSQQPEEAGGGANPQQQQQQPPQVARVETPPVGRGPSPFKTGLARGSVTDQALQSLANGHSTSHVSFGGGGDHGVSRPEPHSDRRGEVDILSDTMGVDFGPYLERVVFEVKTHWYALIPELAQSKKGKLTIEFAILKDGKVAGLHIVSPSGDIGLDRPAYGSITDSNPFPPLPSEFRGQFLELRFRFYYNPEKGEMELPQ